MAKKHDDTEGVPVRLDGAPDHRVDGIAVAVPEVASAPESKSPAKSAASNKE